MMTDHGHQITPAPSAVLAEMRVPRGQTSK
jgi:hypothetical protein